MIDDAKRYVASFIKLKLVHEILPGFKRAMKKCARSITPQGRFTAYILPLPDSKYRLRLLSRRPHGCLSCKSLDDILRVDQLLSAFTDTDVNDHFVECRRRHRVVIKRSRRLVISHDQPPPLPITKTYSCIVSNCVSPRSILTMFGRELGTFLSSSMVPVSPECFPPTIIALFPALRSKCSMMS